MTRNQRLFFDFLKVTSNRWGIKRSRRLGHHLLCRFTMGKSQKDKIFQVAAWVYDQRFFVGGGERFLPGSPMKPKCLFNYCSVFF